MKVKTLKRRHYFLLICFVFLMEQNAFTQETVDLKDLSKGKKCADEKKYNCAIQEFSEVLRLNPQDTVAYIERGKIYLILGTVLSGESYGINYLTGKTESYIDLAVIDFSEAIKQDNKNDYYYFLRSSAYAYKDNKKNDFFPNVIQDMNSAIELDKLNYKYYKVADFFITTSKISLKRQLETMKLPLCFIPTQMILQCSVISIHSI